MVQNRIFRRCPGLHESLSVKKVKRDLKFNQYVRNGSVFFLVIENFDAINF